MSNSSEEVYHQETGILWKESWSSTQFLNVWPLGFYSLLFNIKQWMIHFKRGVLSGLLEMRFFHHPKRKLSEEEEIKASLIDCTSHRTLPCLRLLRVHVGSVHNNHSFVPLPLHHVLHSIHLIVHQTGWCMPPTSRLCSLTAGEHSRHKRQLSNDVHVSIQCAVLSPSCSSNQWLIFHFVVKLHVS